LEGKQQQREESPSTPKRRRQWAGEEIKVMKQYFKEGKTISLHQASQFLETHRFHTARQNIQDKIKTFVRQGRS
jgi:hypothetical protein